MDTMNDKKVRSAEFQQGIFTTKGTKVGERQRIFDQPSRRRFRRRQSYGGRDGAASRINRIGSGLGTGMDGRTTGLVRVVNLRIVKAALRMDKAGQGNLRMNFFMVLGPSTFAKAMADRSGRVIMGTNTRFCHALWVVGVWDRFRRCRAMRLTSGYCLGASARVTMGIRLRQGFGGRDG
jgi:hypothetical protein